MSSNQADAKKKSPRAPSLPLEEAISRVTKFYKAEGRHPAPSDVVLKHIGYSSKNGAALQAVASLGYWGLVERPRDGMLAVSKAFEEYEFNPNPNEKSELLIRFLKTPPIYAELLHRYTDRLPSDASIKYDLIQQGFLPTSADVCVSVFRKSVEFAGYFEFTASRNAVMEPEAIPEPEPDPVAAVDSILTNPFEDRLPVGFNFHSSNFRGNFAGGGQSSPPIGPDDTTDRIPVRLSGGRRAWLEIPTPFYKADKERMKKHIDLLLAEDEEDIDD